MTSLTMRFVWTCPHCGHGNYTYFCFDSQRATPVKIQQCASVGCGERVVVEAAITLHTTTYKLQRGQA